MANNGPFSCHDTETTAVEARDRRVQRARELLADAGWLFDDFVNAEMRRVLTSDPDDMTTREIAYNRARIATELKTGLAALVKEHEADALRKERRESLREAIHGR
jgi:hypothetical protein